MRRVLDFGEAAEGRGQLEAQMILNHKDAIELLVASVSALTSHRSFRRASAPAVDDAGF
jgi:hypothetical protein